MHCQSCESIIRENLKRVAGVSEAIVSSKTGIAEILFEGEAPAKELLEQAVKEAGYEIVQTPKAGWANKIVGVIVAIFIVFVIFQIGGQVTHGIGAVKPSTSGIPVVNAAGGCGCGGGTPKAVDSNVTASQNVSNVQVIKAIYTLDGDIKPNNFEVKKGISVRFEIEVKDSGQGCMSTVMVHSLYPNPQYLQSGKNLVLEFTPEKEGSFNITCAMGVPGGVIKVTN